MISLRKLLSIAILLIALIALPRSFVEILDSGVILVGTRNIPSELIYFPNNESHPGFCYELAKGFADYLGVKMETVEVTDFREYFSPDIFSKVDMIADILTVTEERQKLMEMVNFVENTELFVGRIDVKAKSVKDFVGKRILTFESFAYYKTLIKLLEENGVSYVINRIVQDGEKLKYLTKNPVNETDVEILLVPAGQRYSTYFVYLHLIDGNADIGIFDSISFVQKYFNTMFLRQQVKPLFPAKKEIGHLAFGFSKENKSLANEFQKYLTPLKKTGKYEELFKKYMGVRYIEYLGLIGGK